MGGRTTTRRMIAVRSQQPSPQISQCRDNKNKGGVSGPSGAPALPPVALAIAWGPGNVWAVGAAQLAFTPRTGRRRSALPRSAMISEILDVGITMKNIINVQ